MLAYRDSKDYLWRAIKAHPKENQMSSKKMPNQEQSLHADYFFKTIEDLYQEELMGEHEESKFKTVTFNFPVADACMLSAIAKRFSRSNASFGGEVFAEGVRMLFLALSSEDRRKVAAEADAEANSYFESKGWSGTDESGKPAPANMSHWSRYAAICDEVDSKEASK